MQQKHIGKLLKQATGGILGSAMDLVLYQCYFLFLLPGRTTMYKQIRATEEASMMLDEINHKTISNALTNLIQKGMVKRSKTGALELEITDLGKKRITEIIPTYKEKRPWDGYIYLISYDIPTSSNTKRDLFREYLRRIGCGKLQDSLWMTPYNPTEIVHIFVDEQNIPGTILVSKLGKDGAIGEENQKDLIARIYSYKKLTDAYDEFIQTYTHRNHRSAIQCSINYYSILKNDPQLPFVLEPKNFPAKRAYQILKSRFSVVSAG